MGRAPPAASGEVGGVAQRMLRVGLSGPRASDPRRARARQGRKLPRAQGRHRRQYRRLCLDLRRGHSQRDLQRAAGRRVPHAGHLRAVDRRVHQHGADRSLSRRRPAGSLLRAGAARRRGCARARHRPRRDPPAQPRADRSHALQDADRPDLRLRKLPEGVFAAGRDSDYKGFPKRQAEPRERKAPRLRFCLLRRVVRRGAVALGRRVGARVGFFEAASIRVQPDGSVQRCSAPTITARATPRPSPRSSRPPRRADGQHRDHRGRHRPVPTARALSARARSRSAARRSTARR